MIGLAISANDRAELERAGYRFVGQHLHSASKVCHWTKKSLLNRGHCYKQKFYGIRSHRCLELTPSLPFCDHRCVFCWRNTGVTSAEWVGDVDEAGDILDGAIKSRRLLLMGFGGNAGVDKVKFTESLEPKHCAISLAGEPTLYPKINDLIEACHQRGMTSYLVTNGLHPAALENLVEPTQLYISLVAPDPDTYVATCRPIVSDGWHKLNQSLEFMSSLNCKKVVRLTLVRGVNLKDAAGYANMIVKADADFIEVKAYMFVGFSRKRLTLENMPSHGEIKTFAQELLRETGYSFADESEESRVVLLKK